MVDRSIRRRKNIRPGLITLHANDKLPTRDNNSLFVHFLRRDHACKEESKASYLSLGN